MIPRKVVRLSNYLRWSLFRLTHRRGFNLYQLDSFKMYLDIGEYFTMYERLIGDFEPNKRSLIRDCLREAITFIDIGVNKGDYALLAASQMGPDGKVIAIEPEPENCCWIRKSIAANSFDNIELIEGAAAEKSGSARLFLGKKSGWNSLYKGVGSTDETIEVKTIALDDLDDGTLNADLIKIDVEGAEHRVLAGAADLVDRCRPVIILDLHPNLGADIDAVEEFFRAHDYDGYGLMDLCTRLDSIPRVPMDMVFRPTGS